MTVSEGRTKVSGVVGDHKSLMVGRTIQMAFAEVHTSWMVVEDHKTAWEVRKMVSVLKVGRIEVSVWKVVVHIGALVGKVGAHTHSMGPQMGTSQTVLTARKILQTQ